MAHIDYFFAVFSPWCYLAGNRLEQIAAAHGATISYKPLDVMALFDRTGGTRPAARAPGRIAYRTQEIARWKAHLNMPMLEKPTHYPGNAAPASYAIIAAIKAHEKTGEGDVAGLVQAVMAAVWVDDLDISDDSVLRSCLERTGFDQNLVTTGLFEGAVTYEKNLEEAVEHGVFGAPFYIVRESDQRFWGQDRLEFLDAHLAELGAA